MTSRKGLMIGLIVTILVLVLGPLIFLPGAAFEGSDGAGSDMVAEVRGDYEPWFTPLLERLIGGELPGEVESLFFSLQTAIGVSIIAFGFGYLVARKKYQAVAPEDSAVREHVTN